MELIILTGLSGSGKTKALEWFEDEGYYCVDNMPPALIVSFLTLVASSNEKIEKVAFGIDVRGGSFFEHLEEILKGIKKSDQLHCKVLYLEASDATLVKRYSESRRTHPMGKTKNARAAIEKEKELLQPLREEADVVIDTSKMKVAQLKMELRRLFSEGQSDKPYFQVQIQSFGFKKGLPIESDLVLDVRFIPNPYYVKSLKKLTGRNEKVYNYVMRQDITKQFIDSITKTLDIIIPGYIQEGKYTLNIAVGCTGGQHRSVSVARQLALIMEKKGYVTSLEHRDLNR